MRQWFAPDDTYARNKFEKVALACVGGLIVLTFVGTSAQALLWRSSDWLVGAVLPAVVVEETNVERAGYAATSLARSPLLDAAATAKAEHMAANGYFAHFAPDGTTPWEFFADVNYDYVHAGENLAVHFNDADAVVRAWMNSPTHKENIVDSKFTEIGVGTARGQYEGYETIFVVQLFGTPTDTPIAPALATRAAPDTVSAPTTLSEPLSVPEPTPATPEPVELLAAATEDAAIAGLATPAPVSDSAPAPVNESSPRGQTSPTMPPIPVGLPTLAPPLVPSDRVVASDFVPEVDAEPVASLPPVVVSNGVHSGHTGLSGLLTRPQLILDTVYSLLVGVAIICSIIALLGETRRLHFRQVSYAVALLLLVGGLWWVQFALVGTVTIA
jgi:hypothetical protein